MDAPTIQMLAPCMPLAGVYMSAQNPAIPEDWPVYAKNFVWRYTSLDFGWHVAKELASHRRPFLTPLYGRDSWVFKAYLMCLDSRRNYNPYVAEAYSLYALKPEHGSPREKIKALLTAIREDEKPDRHIQAVSRMSGFPVATIEAYEVLFYNLLDRRDDGILLSEAMYPQTRLVELRPDYIETSKLTDLVQRAGFNSGDIGLAAFLSGFGNNKFLEERCLQSDSEEEISRRIMVNGMMWAYANLLNQSTPGMSRATALLAAKRQAGGGITVPPSVDLDDEYLRNLGMETKIVNDRVDTARARNAAAAMVTLDIES